MSEFSYEAYWADLRASEFEAECLSRGERKHASGVLYEPLEVRSARPARCGDPTLESEMGDFHCPEWFENRRRNVSRANARKASAAGRASGRARLLAKARKLGLI